MQAIKIAATRSLSPPAGTNFQPTQVGFALSLVQFQLLRPNFKKTVQDFQRESLRANVANIHLIIVRAINGSLIDSGIEFLYNELRVLP